MHTKYITPNPVVYTCRQRTLGKEVISDILAMLCESPGTLIAGNCIFYKPCNSRLLISSGVMLSSLSTPYPLSRAGLQIGKFK